MTFSDTLHAARIWALGAGSVVVMVCAVLLATGSSSSRTTVLSQLQRPAVYPATTVGPGSVSTQITAGVYRLHLQLGPNRASRADAVRLSLTQAGEPVGAVVHLTYGMPSMNMTNVLSTRLRRTASGDYRTTDPKLSMPGVWQLRFDVVPIDGRRFAVIVNDRMNL